MSTSQSFANPFQMLEAIDVMLLRRHYKDAIATFFTLLDKMTQSWYGASFARPGHYGDQNRHMFELCERAAKQWHQILSSDLDLTKVDYTPLIANISVLHALLMGSAQGSLDDFITALHRKTGGRYQTQEFIRMVLAWCPASRSGFRIFDYYAQGPELIMAQALGCVGGMGLVSEQADQHRNLAIDFLIANQSTPIEKLRAVSLSMIVLEAWMRCSYASHPRRHHIKPLLNRMIAQGFEQLSGGMAHVEIRVPELARSDKPLMVVPMEAMSGGHAMYRCYAGIIAECRRHFYTVGLAATKHYDAATEALFDAFFNVNEISSGDKQGLIRMAVLEKIILNWKPALVYYPSVGMAIWGVALANRRLAPVQVMSFGHPATTMSPVMDYGMLEQVWNSGNPEVYSEKIIVIEDGAMQFQVPDKTVRIAPVLALPADGVLRVAIPSLSQKLTGPFVTALRKVEDAMGNRVRFVFFTGAKSVHYAASVRALSGQLINIECHGMLKYDEYIAQLNRCHLHAGTFPFGGTNSLIDSLRQGLPILALEGDEAHARVDSDFIRRAGLPEYLVCKTEDEYAERMIELLSNPDRLLALRRYLVEEVNIDSIFLRQGRPEDYARAMQGLVTETAAIAAG